MNQIIKFLSPEDCRKLFSDKHYLMGFYRKTPEFVISCSIERDDGFQSTCICNYATYCSPDNCFQTYDGCYTAMMKELESLECRKEPGVGQMIWKVTSLNRQLWKQLDIKEEYPLEAVLKCFEPQVIDTGKGRKTYFTTL